MPLRTPAAEAIHNAMIDYVIESGRIAESLQDLPRYSDGILGELCERFSTNTLTNRNLVYVWLRRMFPDEAERLSHVKKRVAIPVLNYDVPAIPMNGPPFPASFGDSARSLIADTCVRGSTAPHLRWSAPVQDNVKPIVYSTRSTSRSEHMQAKPIQRATFKSKTKMQFSLAADETAYWFDGSQAKPGWGKWIGKRVKELACLPCSLTVKSNHFDLWSWKEFVTYAKCAHPGCGSFSITKLGGSDCVIVNMKGLTQHPEKMRKRALRGDCSLPIDDRDRAA